MKSAIDKGLRYLRQGQSAEGPWIVEGHADPGITALAVSAFLHSPRQYSSEDGPFIRKPLEYLASLAKDNGAIYSRGLANYVTCVAVLALESSGEAEYEPLLAKARGFLLTVQADEGEGLSPSDRFYGGAGYGANDSRSYLSNVSYWIEGVRATGVKSDHESIRKALQFINRCQNHSETNTGTWKDEDSGNVYVAGNDGGATYYPGGSSAGYEELEGGKRVARSYGSMTYAMLKCYLFAGVERDDPRFQAAVKWIGENFDVDKHPGFESDDDPDAAYQGIFFYYHSMARALDLLGEETIVDADGTPRSWRAELARKVLSMQREDGSWVNERNERWWEGVPLLATSYALLTLEICYGSY